MRLLLFVVLLSSAAHAQAVRPAPSPGPLVQQPPSYPGATLTPAGAGASHGGLAAPEKVLPRSPNKRLLPPTKEPGLWAADGAPVAVARRQLWGVVIPLPDGEAADVLEYEAWHCSMYMEGAAKGTPSERAIRAFPEDVLRCAVAISQHHCATSEVAAAKQRKARGEELDPDRNTVLAMIEAHMAALHIAWCSGITLSTDQRAVLSRVLRAWDAAGSGQ